MKVVLNNEILKLSQSKLSKLRHKLSKEEVDDIPKYIKTDQFVFKYSLAQKKRSEDDTDAEFMARLHALFLQHLDRKAAPDLSALADGGSSKPSTSKKKSGQKNQDTAEIPQSIIPTEMTTIRVNRRPPPPDDLIDTMAEAEAKTFPKRNSTKRKRKEIISEEGEAEAIIKPKSKKGKAREVASEESEPDAMAETDINPKPPASKRVIIIAPKPSTSRKQIITGTQKTKKKYQPEPEPDTDFEAEATPPPKKRLKGKVRQPVPEPSADPDDDDELPQKMSKGKRRQPDPETTDSEFEAPPPLKKASKYKRRQPEPVAVTESESEPEPPSKMASKGKKRAGETAIEEEREEEDEDGDEDEEQEVDQLNDYDGEDFKMVEEYRTRMAPKKGRVYKVPCDACVRRKMPCYTQNSQRARGACFDCGRLKTKCEYVVSFFFFPSYTLMYVFSLGVQTRGVLQTDSLYYFETHQESGSKT